MSRRCCNGCDSASGFVGFLTGLILGGAVAVLCAPRPGRQTRDMLGERMAQVGADMQTAVAAARTTATSRIAELRREAGLE